MKAAESVQSFGGAGNFRDGQGGCVAGKDGVSKKKNTAGDTYCNMNNR